MAKDFSKVNTRPVYESIQEATQEPPKRKERKTYTAQEAEDFANSLQTPGRKGVKLRRINMAFTPANYEYIKTMAQVRGENMTFFINHVLDESRAANADVYEKALEFRKAL